jgi:hypothetical protein
LKRGDANAGRRQGDIRRDVSKVKNEQQIYCGIAQKTVSISLRPGGGFREPEGVHVRCSERDCQYADLNQPPCPLRTEMFANASDREIPLYLAAHPGVRVCYTCMAEALGVPHGDVRRAIWRLQGQPGVSIQPSRCGVCQRRVVTVAVARDAVLAVPDAGTEIAVPRVGAAVTATVLTQYLRAQQGVGWCTHCLARQLHTTPAAVREATEALQDKNTLFSRTATCAGCLQTRTVILHMSTSHIDASSRVLAFLLQTAGAAHCDGCIALAADLGLAEVRAGLSSPEVGERTASGEGRCEGCGRSKQVIRLRSPSREGQRLGARMACGRDLAPGRGVARMPIGMVHVESGSPAIRPVRQAAW